MGVDIISLSGDTKMALFYSSAFLMPLSSVSSMLAFGLATSERCRVVHYSK